MRIVSQRKTARIVSVYAVVTKDSEGREGVVRRDTPSGTQPWTTDDPELVDTMLSLAIKQSGRSDCYLVRFDRV